MELREGYKQTDVGVVPDDWAVKSIEEVAPLQRGFDLPARKIQSGTVPVVYSNGVDKFHNIAMVKGPGVVTGRSGTLGKIHYIESGYWPHNTSLWVTGFNGNNPKFVFYLYDSIHFERFASGSGVPTLNRNDAHSFRIAVPTRTEEQRAIATALSDMDALLEGLDQLIAKKRELKQATMQQLLTGKTRLPGFEGEWVIKKISEISHVGRGRVISHKEISRSSAPLYPVYSSQTSNDGVMGYLDTYDFEGNYVTWTTDGANAGTVFARSGRFNCTNVCGTIKLINSDHQFIAAALGRVTQPHVSRHLGNPKLMNDVVKNIGIKLPEDREEQTAIATILSDMDAEIQSLEQRRTKTRDLKQAMMQELLTGRTRLVEHEGQTNG